MIRIFILSLANFFPSRRISENVNFSNNTTQDRIPGPLIQLFGLSSQSNRDLPAAANRQQGLLMLASAKRALPRIAHEGVAERVLRKRNHSAGAERKGRRAFLRPAPFAILRPAKAPPASRPA